MDTEPGLVVLEGDLWDSRAWLDAKIAFSDRVVSVHQAIGMIGFGSRNDVWIVDSLGLADPLAARVKRRSELVDHLTRSGIETKIIYPIPIHLLPAYQHLNYRCGDFPNAEKLCKQILSFPLYPGMTESQVLQISDVIEQFYVG